LLKNPSNINTLTNSQSLASLLKVPVLKAGINDLGLQRGKNSSSERKLDRKFEALPTIKTKKNVARESPYYKERKKTVEKNRFSDLMNFHVRLSFEILLIFT